MHRGAHRFLQICLWPPWLRAARLTTPWAEERDSRSNNPKTLCSLDMPPRGTDQQNQPRQDDEVVIIEQPAKNAEAQVDSEQDKAM